MDKKVAKIQELNTIRSKRAKITLSGDMKVSYRKTVI